jgi:hypothetical protein
VKPEQPSALPARRGHWAAAATQRAGPRASAEPSRGLQAPRAPAGMVARPAGLRLVALAELRLVAPAAPRVQRAPRRRATFRVSGATWARGRWTSHRLAKLGPTALQVRTSRELRHPRSIANAALVRTAAFPHRAISWRACRGRCVRRERASKRLAPQKRTARAAVTTVAGPSRYPMGCRPAYARSALGEVAARSRRSP